MHDRRCLLHVQWHIWRGSYRQAVADFHAARRHFRCCTQSDLIENGKRNDVESLRLVFQRKRPSRCVSAYTLADQLICCLFTCVSASSFICHSVADNLMCCLFACVSASSYICHSVADNLMCCLFACVSASSYICHSVADNLMCCLFACVSASSFICHSVADNLMLSICLCISLIFYLSFCGR